VKHAVLHISLVVSMACAACDGGSAGLAVDAALTPPADAAVVLDPGTPELPPMGQASLEAWLMAAHHRSWACESTISAARLNGAHGRHRICSNRLLVESTGSGTYPVGAASVKEMYDQRDQPNGYAVGIKVAPGAGASTWYWYERTGRSATSRPVADKIAEKICGPDCHAAAPRDHVFFRAQ
jgi:hypothetical protein